MPICTNCTHSIPYLYTVYESARNLRLEQCQECKKFADPYVEHDALLLVLDLILLKRGVYRHLLYNRGTDPRKVVGGASDVKENLPSPNGRSEVKRPENERERARWLRIFRLGGVLVAFDAFIRWSHSHRVELMKVGPWTHDTIREILRTLIGSLAETIAFHSGVLFGSFIILTVLNWVRDYKPHSTHTTSGIRDEFRYSLIPLTIFYSSLTKFFLLYLFSIWRPDSTSVVEPARVRYAYLWARDEPSSTRPFIAKLLEIWDEDRLDREWVVRNVMGGMSAGFGLRVILDCHAIFILIIILFGWSFKTRAANLVSEWVGGNTKAGEVWLAYSIP